MPPDFLPRLLIWTIVALSVLLPFEHLLRPGGRAHFGEARSKRIHRVAWLAAGLLALLVLSVKWASTLDHVKLSLFLAALGILAGSLGGRADSQALVRGVLFIDEET